MNAEQIWLNLESLDVNLFIKARDQGLPRANDIQRSDIAQMAYSQVDNLDRTQKLKLFEMLQFFGNLKQKMKRPEINLAEEQRYNEQKQKLERLKQLKK